MRKITPLAGACIKVLEDGTVQARNWNIEGETDADDATANGRALAIIDWMRARVITSRLQQTTATAPSPHPE